MFGRICPRGHTSIESIFHLIIIIICYSKNLTMTMYICVLGPPFFCSGTNCFDEYIITWLKSCDDAPIPNLKKSEMHDCAKMNSLFFSLLFVCSANIYPCFAGLREWKTRSFSAFFLPPQ